MRLAIADFRLGVSLSNWLKSLVLQNAWPMSLVPLSKPSYSWNAARMKRNTSAIFDAINGPNKSPQADLLSRYRTLMVPFISVG